MTGLFPIHGGQLRQIADRFGIPQSQLIDFSANINPDGPPPAVVSALRASLEDPAILGSYPDLDQVELKRSIANYAGVSLGNIGVANGFVPLLDAALRALKIRHCLLPVPAFVEYRSALTRAQVKITPHLLASESHFRYDIDTMFAGDHDAILLANPQNPSGISSDPQLILQLVARAAERRMFILLDEAFVDYIPTDSLTSYVNQFPNLIVFRSVTKFHGIPGMRVAYVVAAPQHIRSIGDNLPPWPVTTLASHAVIAALDDTSYADRTRQLNQRRRALMQSDLERFGIHVYNSAANFLLLRLPLDIVNDDFWTRMIVEQHIVLRDCFNYEGLGVGHVRVAVRTEFENTLLVNAAGETLSRCRASDSNFKNQA
jgi:threonine-phosphate decarboxylase